MVIYETIDFSITKVSKGVFKKGECIVTKLLLLPGSVTIPFGIASKQSIIKSGQKWLTQCKK